MWKVLLYDSNMCCFNWLMNNRDYSLKVHHSTNSSNLSEVSQSHYFLEMSTVNTQGRVPDTLQYIYYISTYSTTISEHMQWVGSQSTGDRMQVTEETEQLCDTCVLTGNTRAEE